MHSNINRPRNTEMLIALDGRCIPLSDKLDSGEGSIRSSNGEFFSSKTSDSEHFKLTTLSCSISFWKYPLSPSNNFCTLMDGGRLILGDFGEDMYLIKGQAIGLILPQMQL